MSSHVDLPSPVGDEEALTLASQSQFRDKLSTDIKSTYKKLLACLSKLKNSTSGFSKKSCGKFTEIYISALESFLNLMNDYIKMSLYEDNNLNIQHFQMLTCCAIELCNSVLKLYDDADFADQYLSSLSPLKTLAIAAPAAMKEMATDLGLRKEKDSDFKKKSCFYTIEKAIKDLQKELESLYSIFFNALNAQAVTTNPENDSLNSPTLFFLPLFFATEEVNIWDCIEQLYLASLTCNVVWKKYNPKLNWDIGSSVCMFFLNPINSAITALETEDPSDTITLELPKFAVISPEIDCSCSLYYSTRLVDDFVDSKEVKCTKTELLGALGTCMEKCFPKLKIIEEDLLICLKKIKCNIEKKCTTLRSITEQSSEKFAFNDNLDESEHEDHFKSPLTFCTAVYKEMLHRKEPKIQENPANFPTIPFHMRIRMMISGKLMISGKPFEQMYYSEEAPGYVLDLRKKNEDNMEQYLKAQQSEQEKGDYLTICRSQYKNTYVMKTSAYLPTGEDLSKTSASPCAVTYSELCMPPSHTDIPLDDDLEPLAEPTVDKQNTSFASYNSQPRTGDGSASADRQPQPTDISLFGTTDTSLFGENSSSHVTSNRGGAGISTQFTKKSTDDGYESESPPPSNINYKKLAHTFSRMSPLQDVAQGKDPLSELT